MKRARVFAATLVGLFILFHSSSPARAAGWLREKIKGRITERLASEPPPQTNHPASEKIQAPGDYTESLELNGRTRYFRVHVPKSYSPQTAASVLFVLHGGGGDMGIQSNDEFYKQISKSESEGYIAVFPNGFSRFASGKLATWNAGRCCGKARDEKVDDVGFLRAVFDTLSRQLNIDKQKVFAAGMSNGGMMAYRLACEMSDVFQAIASVAGTDNTVNCQPRKPVSILHIHAKDDDHVLFAGGAGKTFRDPSLVADFTSVPNTIAKWVKLNDCKGEPVRVLDRPGAACDRYSRCRDGVAVELCVTETGGHSWPGGKKPRSLAGGAPSKAISANDVMWEFFNRNNPPRATGRPESLRETR